MVIKQSTLDEINVDEDLIREISKLVEMLRKKAPVDLVALNKLSLSLQTRAEIPPLPWEVLDFFIKVLNDPVTIDKCDEKLLLSFSTLLQKFHIKSPLIMSKIEEEPL